MVNKSKAKSGASSKRLEMKSKKPKRENPFERRFGREKHKVLNRKSKVSESSFNGAVGRPGLSRAKAIEKRKATLLQEYKLRDKANVFLDRRIGERDATMSVEEKMVARFAAAEKIRRKKSLFQLGEEDETLTHFGQALSEIERFDDPRSDDEDDGDERKKLDAQFVEEAHFGGFMTKTDIEFSQGKSNNRKDWIENMISDSKKRKAEKQRDLEEAESLTKTLDTEWKSVMPSLRSSGHIYTSHRNEKEENDKKGSSNADSYDVLLRELAFEKGKQQAKDRLKTEDEIVREEKEKLEKLEADRVRRMKGEVLVEEEEEEEEDHNDEAQDDNEEDGDTDDGISDLESSEDEEDEVAEKETEKKKKKGVTKPKMVDAAEKEIIIEAATKQIPYTFTVPASYGELLAHFDGRNAEEHSTIVQRIVKCNHPQLGNNNKESLQPLFVYILQYVHDCSANFEPDGDGAGQLRIIEALTPYLYDLAQFSPQPSAKAVLSVLLEKHEEYSKDPRKALTFESLIFLKITCLLFPASDYRHPVVTPALQFASHVLSKCRFNSRQSIASGLFVSTLFTEGLQLSKRFSPELINFLVGIVYMSFPKKKDVALPYLPPFRVVGPEAELLCDKFDARTKPDRLKWSDAMSLEDIDSQFAVSCLHAALGLVEILLELWKDHECAKQIFSYLEKFLPLLPGDSLHKDVRAQVAKVEEATKSLSGEKKAISKERVKPKILRLYEPEYENDFDPFVKKHKGPKDKQDVSKLLHKMKREKKGAKKDIRADVAFLASQKAKEARERDEERMKKTREIMSGLGNQEGECRQLQKKKKRMK